MANLHALAANMSHTIHTICPLTFFGLADRVARYYKNNIYNFKNTNNFAIWNGRFFDTVPASRLIKYVRTVIENIPNEAGKDGYCVTMENEFVTVDDLKKFKTKMSTLSALNQTIGLLATCGNIEKDESEFDQAVDHIVTQNGILNLRTGLLRDHDPDFLSMRIVTVPYDKNAKCPDFQNFIEAITCNNPELARYLQVLIGYFFTGITHEQQLYLFHGFGSNGKSTLLNILLQIAGNYGITTPASTLMAKTSGSTTSDLPRLKKAWLVNASETNEGEKLDEAGIKIMTGGDPITARLLFQLFETYFAQYKVVLSVNILPEIRGCDHGIFRRIVVVPFNKMFKEAERDQRIIEKLKPELAGIFAWIVEGAMEYFKNGIPNCAAVEKATEKYLMEMDRVESFLEDECITDRVNGKYRIPLADLWEMSLSWSRKNCSEPFPKKIFNNHILRKGFKQSKSGSVRYWEGIKPKVKGF